MFMWTLCHGKVLPNQERYRRGMTSNPCCHHFQEETETLDHIFCYCKLTENLWPNLFDGDSWRLTKNMSFGDWFDRNICRKDPQGEEGAWNDNFALCMWLIWR